MLTFFPGEKQVWHLHATPLLFLRYHPFLDSKFSLIYNSSCGDTSYFPDDNKTGPGPIFLCSYFSLPPFFTFFSLFSNPVLYFSQLMKKKTAKACTLLLSVSLLFLSVARGEEVLRKLKVVTELANIRLKPSIGSIIIKQFPEGTILESTGQEGEWFLIKLIPDELEQVSGYVHESMVIIIEGPPREQEEPEIIEEEQEEPEKPKEEAETPVEEEKIEETPPQEPLITPPAQPVVTPPLPTKPPKFPFNLVFSGGGSYISGGDLNDGSLGLADYHSDTSPFEPQGKARPAHLSYILGGELALALSSHFSLGIGVDYFLGERKSFVKFPEDPSSETLTIHPKMQAVPLRLAISYYPVRSLYAKIGVEYYFAKCAYYYRFQRVESWEEWQGEATAQDFGVLAGLGYELEFTSSFNFIIEATIRYARISGFKGRDRSRDSTGTDYIEEGTLYFYQVQAAGEDSYPFLFIREDTPTEGGVFNPREAIINFSGLSLKTGFKIKF
jgi:hypothetical protein